MAHPRTSVSVTPPGWYEPFSNDDRYAVAHWQWLLDNRLIGAPLPDPALPQSDTPRPRNLDGLLAAAAGRRAPESAR